MRNLQEELNEGSIAETTTKKRKQGKSKEVIVPHYGDVEVDGDGNALLPFNFLPTMVDKLHDDWFYRTYSYYKFFDKEQRDGNGDVCAPPDLVTANPANIKKWRELAIRIFVDSFAEEGKYHYGLEIGRMSLKDGHKCEVLKDGRKSETPDLAQEVIFNQVAPDLLGKGHIGELIAIVWKWMHVPNLEGNNQWVKDSLKVFFKLHDARVVLSNKKCGGQRVHSIAYLFKKYGTQSAVRTFKNNQRKQFGFTIEVNKFKKNDGSYPPCEEGETWSSHNIEGYLDKGVKNLMRRNGGLVFLVRHHDQDWDHVKLFKSDLFNAVQKAINYGCEKKEVVNELKLMMSAVEGGFVLPNEERRDNVMKHSAEDLEPIKYGGWSKRGRKSGQRDYDALYAEDIGNLNEAGKNMNDDDREDATKYLDQLDNDWTSPGLVKSPLKSPPGKLRTSPRKKAATPEKGSPKPRDNTPQKEMTTTPKKKSGSEKARSEGKQSGDTEKDAGVIKSTIQKEMEEMDKRRKNKASNQGVKRKSVDYGSRDGMSLVGKYRSGIGKQFVVWHCKSAFTEGSACVDGVCGRCKINDENKGHSCKNCKQKVCDYKYEDNQTMMMRERKNWEGPGPEKCAICRIIM